MRAILMFHWPWGTKSQKTMSANHEQFFKSKESWSGIEPRSFCLPALHLTASPNLLRMMILNPEHMCFSSNNKETKCPLQHNCSLLLFSLMHQLKPISKRLALLCKNPTCIWFLQLQYNMKESEVRYRTLQVTVWDHDMLKENNFLGAVYIRLRDLDLTTETTRWYPLQKLQMTGSGLFA